MREDRITLEVCPSSNVASGAVPSMAAHPLPRLLAAGTVKQRLLAARVIEG